MGKFILPSAFLGAGLWVLCIVYFPWISVGILATILLLLVLLRKDY